MISAWHLLWIVPLAVSLGIAFAPILSANTRAVEREALLVLFDAFERLGAFGRLFAVYKGCPRGAMGRACVPIEEEVLMMQPIRDVDGGEWIPVNADALRELVDRYKEAQHHD